jgi:Putative transposase
VQGAMPQEPGFEQELCAEMQDFCPHAAVRCEADDREELERLCRYVTCPALARERVASNAAERVVLKRKTPWRHGTTRQSMSMLEFMQRLAALVPRPRLHLIRLHAVLAPNANLRAQVVPTGKDLHLGCLCGHRRGASRRPAIRRSAAYRDECVPRSTLAARRWRSSVSEIRPEANRRVGGHEQRLVAANRRSMLPFRRPQAVRLDKTARTRSPERSFPLPGNRPQGPSVLRDRCRAVQSG